VKVSFWGVRGSIPVPGKDMLRYGGDTACVEVSVPGAPSLVLDCGTGARRLGMEMLGRTCREMYLAFTHFHIDHVLGFPFFDPIFAPSFELGLVLPCYRPEEARALLSQFLNGVFHPLRVPDVPAKMNLTSMFPTRAASCPPYELRAVAMNHPGGACGYRVEHGGKALAYFTDTAPFAKPDEGVMVGQEPTPAEARIIEAMEGADLLIFDTMFSREAYLEKMSWGHAYPEYAAALARAAGVPELYLFHHAPNATDDVLDEVARRWADSSDPVVRLAREGGIVDLEG